jgi:hypothetical protein
MQNVPAVTPVASVQHTSSSSTQAVVAAAAVVVSVVAVHSAAVTELDGYKSRNSNSKLTQLQLLATSS